MSVGVIQNGIRHFESKQQKEDYLQVFQCIEHAIEQQDFEYVKDMCRKGYGISPQMRNRVVEMGNVDMIDFFYAQDHQLSWDILRISSKLGHLPIMEYAREKGVAWSRDGEELYIASLYNQPLIVEYALQQNCPFHPQAISIAAQKGHMDILKQLIQSKTEIDGYLFASIVNNLLKHNSISILEEKINTDAWWKTFFSTSKQRDLSYYLTIYPEVKTIL